MRMFVVLIVALFFFTMPVFSDFKNELPDVVLPVTPDKQKNTEKNKNPSQGGVKNPAASSAQPQTKAPAPQGTQPQNTTAGSTPADQEFGTHNSDAPVFFSGKYGEGSRKTGVLNLVGDAVIIQDDTTLKSNKAHIFSQPGSVPVSGANRLQRAVATGNVRIFKKVSHTAPEIKATGDEAELLIPQKILTLKGRAKIWRGEEYLHANVIRIDLIKGDYTAIEPEGTVDPRSANSKMNTK